MEFGVQTFTVRKAQKKSITDAYLPLIRMGIRRLEIARIDFNEKNALEIRELKDKHGIEVASIQVKPKYVSTEIDKLACFCEITECKTIVISMLPFECILGREEKFYSFIAKLDPLFDLYEKRGITLAYHHHNWEYVTLQNGKTRMAELIGKTEKIRFVHDTYWSARSGVDPAAQIEEFGSRLIGIHLRDLAQRKRGLGVKPINCAIGDGILNFERIIRAAERTGSPYYVIEQKTDTPYKDIEKSYLFIKKLTEETDLI